MSYFIEPRSVDNYLSGICSELENFFPDVRNIRKEALVSKTMQGCKRLRSKGVKRKAPLTPDDLITAVLTADLNNYDNLLFIAQLVTGFNALMRLSELAWPDNRSLQDYRKLVLRQTVTVEDDTYEFHLPSHKADASFRGNRILVARENGTANPHFLFTQYLNKRDTAFPFNPELWLKSNGTQPTRKWFLENLTRLFPQNVAGQSMRSGGATALACKGTPPHLIQATGRWSSEAFQIYIRAHPTLLAGLVHSKQP